MSNGIKLITIVCGDRNWHDRLHIGALIKRFPPETIVISGGAAGADTIAWELAREAGMRSVRLDAPWAAYGKRAGPVRNGWMLDMLTDLWDAHADAAVHVHAFHNAIASSKGTADMLSKARAASVPYTIHTSADDA